MMKVLEAAEEKLRLLEEGDECLPVDGEGGELELDLIVREA